LFCDQGRQLIDAIGEGSDVTAERSAHQKIPFASPQIFTVERILGATLVWAVSPIAHGWRRLALPLRHSRHTNASSGSKFRRAIALGGHGVPLHLAGAACHRIGGIVSDVLAFPGELADRLIEVGQRWSA
jgi:hypothetical protein